MSGSGGYYKYRCKYWLTFNCPHWVWVNNAPCAHCLADGRDDDPAPKSSTQSAVDDLHIVNTGEGGRRGFMRSVKQDYNNKLPTLSLSFLRDAGLTLAGDYEDNYSLQVTELD